MDGRKPLVTLRDAAKYITELPKAEHDADEWQARDAGAIARRRTRRACDVRSHRRHEGIEPSRRAGVRPVAKSTKLESDDKETRLRWEPDAV